MVARLVAAREALGLSRYALADLIGEDEVAVRRMEAGRAEVWPELLAWLERQAARRRADPTPSGPGVPPVGSRSPQTRKATREVAPGSGADRLRRALSVIHWSTRAFGEALGLSGQAVRHWADGTGKVRPEALAWVERQAKAFQDDPPPRRVLPGGVWSTDVAQAAAVLGTQARMLRQGGAAAGAESLERVLALLDRLPSMLREMQQQTAEAEGELVPEGSLVIEPPPPPGPRPPGPMTGERLERILDFIGWTPNDLAHRIGAPALERDIRRWIRNQRPIADDVADWLEDLAEVAAQRPPEVAVWAHTLHRLRKLRSDPPEGADVWEERLTEAAQHCPDRLKPKKPQGPMRLEEIL